MCNKWNIEEKFKELKLKIDTAMYNAGRCGDTISVIAVSKGQNVDKINTLYNLGHKDFGENYIQELEKKRIALQSKCPKIRWHYIGNIQTNKILHIVRNFSVHSVSSLKQSKALSKCSNIKDPLNIFLQVNLKNENHKKGFLENELILNILEIYKLKNLKLQGLMAVLPLEKDNKNKFWFLKLKSIRNKLYEKLMIKSLKLSIGMSKDFEEAIKYGSTCIRIGSMIFGPRFKK